MGKSNRYKNCFIPTAIQILNRDFFFKCMYYANVLFFLLSSVIVCFVLLYGIKVVHAVQDKFHSNGTIMYKVKYLVYF